MINLLTGMLKPDSGSGSIRLNGMNYADELEQIRRTTGVCVQQDILYDRLTVKEHLRYYAELKGVPDRHLEAEVDSIVATCALAGEELKQAANLSGGNKRKLCLGIALVGGSKLVFLDEPSSGLDPNSRQSIWAILRQIRDQNRTIVLTTHHLEEAEILAQRVGIMNHGKLAIVGDCAYIRSKFGVGYHLNITYRDGKEELIRTVSTNVPDMKLDEQSAGNMLKFILPLAQQKKFAGLFQELEGMGAEISLTMSSLEDAFVRIGMDADLEEGATLPDLPVIPFPEEIRSTYSFSSQWVAVFLRKFHSTRRSWATVISILFPLLFLIVGLVVAIKVFDRDDKSRSSQQTRLGILSYCVSMAFTLSTSVYCGLVVTEK